MTSTRKLPNHLGGHSNNTHVDEGAIAYLLSQFKLRTGVDVGCGPGGQVEVMDKAGIATIGIDGDFTLERKDPDSFILHDFREPFVTIDGGFDIGWSVEFLEHIEQRCLDNVFQVFTRCRYVVFTFARRGHKGHHHVNCRNFTYWKKVFNGYGFVHCPRITRGLKEHSTMRRDFMRETGCCFRNKAFPKKEG